MPTKCARHDCNDVATHYPKIMVPATGYAIDGHQPLGTTLSLPLCLPHCQLFSAKEFLDCPKPIPGRTNRVLFEVMARGKIPPDFERAYIQPIPLDCAEAQTLFKAQAIHDGANQPVSSKD